MRYLHLLISFILCYQCLPFTAYSQTIIDRSDQKRPYWLAGEPPSPGNKTFRYIVAQAEDRSKAKARQDCVIDLVEKVKQDKEITGEGKSGGSLDQSTGRETSYIEFVHTSKSKAIHIVYQKTDEYWELVSYKNGTNQYRCYTLYAVANNPNQTPVFDNISFSYKYGARGLIRSVIPGWGQLYKGSKAKGLCIMGGEAIFIGGIITFESMRRNYTVKINQTHNAGQIRHYSSKADNCGTFRNICIGGAAALYVYNLIDALVANGTKRTIIKKNKLAIFPVASPEGNGIGLAYQF